jgi:hypothetical protein
MDGDGWIISVKITKFMGGAELAILTAELRRGIRRGTLRIAQFPGKSPNI